MASKPQTRVGRPKAKERMVSMPAIYGPPSLEDGIAAASAKAGMPMSEWGRDVLEKYLSGQIIDLANIGLNNSHLKFLTKAPAGPWEEALEHAGNFVLNESIASELEVNEGDVAVRVIGDSMHAAGIFDGSLLIMRPLGPHKTPRRGEVALVEIVDSNDDYQSTIKHWAATDPVKLTDGDGKDFPLPENTKSVRAVAVARGIIGRL